jgi:V/A-type H+-transporting ATPase subunit C
MDALIESLLVGSGAVAACVGRDAAEDCGYSYGLGRVWALEGRLLPPSKLAQLAEASTPLEVVRLLAETDYGPGLQAVRGWPDFDAALDAALARTYELVRGLLPEPDRALVDVLRMRHDLLTLHAAIRGVISGHAPERIARTLSRAGTIRSPVLEALAAARSPRDLAALVGDEGYAQCIRSALEAAAPAAGESAGAGAAGPQRLACALDGAFYGLLERKVSSAGGRRAGVARELLRALVDVQNLRTLVRAHVQRAQPPPDAFVAGGTAGRGAFLELAQQGPDALRATFAPGTLLGGLSAQAAEAASGARPASAFERSCDDALARWARERTRARTLALDVVLAYALAREREVAALKMAFAAKEMGLDTGTLRSLARDVHG